MRPGVSTLLAGFLVALAVTAGSVLDVVAPPPGERGAPVAIGRELDSGAWYCAAGATAGGDTMAIVAALPPTSPTSAAVRTDTLEDGTQVRGGEIEVLPGRVAAQAVAEGNEAVGVAGRWWVAPAAVGRTWERRTTGEPSGRVEGPCEPEPSEAWYLPGVTTVGGAQARVAVANPFETDAAITLDLVTPEGLETPELLKNVAVPARSVRTIELNRFAPERADLGVVVRVRAGRVVAEAWQSLDPGLGGVQGVTLAKLAPELATTWTVPWFAGQGAESWLWVVNPSERPASVGLTVHTGAGGTPPEGLEELTVPPGAVRRVDLRGTLAEGVPGGGVTVTSGNGVPVAVSGATRVASQRTGFVVQLGQPEADPLWVIPGGTTTGRRTTLHLVNPTAATATVDVVVSTPTGVRRPEELRGVVVAPGTAVDLDLTGPLGDSAAHAVSVLAVGSGVVAGIESSAVEGRLDLVAFAGVPGRAWAPSTPVRPVRFAPGMGQRLGTLLGPATTPSPTPPPTPLPTPSP